MEWGIVLKYKFGIKVKLLSSFLGFSLIVFILLWILQVVLLDDVYRTIKINSVRNAAEKMDGMSDEELHSKADRCLVNLRKDYLESDVEQLHKMYLYEARK